MGYASDKDIEERERNQKWYTLECVQCHEKKPCREEDYKNHVNGIEPFWCDECKQKLFAREEEQD